MKPSRTGGIPGRACRALVVSYTLPGVVYTGCVFYASTLPITVPDDGPVLPGWLWVVIVLGVMLLGLPWALLPLPLLITGVVRVRRAATARWRRTAAFTAAVAASAVLEVLVITQTGYRYPSPVYAGPGLVSWAALAEAFGFAALGAVMIVVVSGAVRTEQSPVRATAGRWCQVLAAGYAVLNAGDSAAAIYPPARLSSVLFGWLNQLPGWLGGTGFYAQMALPALWQLLPVLLLIIGIVQLRRAVSARWQWVAAWCGLIAGAVLLEAAPLFSVLASPGLPARNAVNWLPAAQTAGFLAVGAAMIWVVRRAERTPQPAATGETAAG